MEQLRDALKSHILECCQQLAGEPVQFRSWTRIVRDKAGQTSFPIETKPDLSGSVLRLRVHQLEAKMPSFKRVVEVVRRDPRLRAILLTDAGGNPITNSESEVWWLENFFCGPLLYAYVGEANGFQFDEGLFGELFEDLRRDMESPGIKVTELSPLMNVEIESDRIVVEHDVQLRRLSTDEIEDWLNPLIPQAPFSPWPLTVDGLLGLQSAVEVTYQQERHAPSGSTTESRDKVSRLVTAIRLLTDGCPRVAFTRIQTSGFVNRGATISSGVSMPRLLGLAKIEKPNESRLVDLYGKLKSSPNITKMGLALARWNAAGDRPTEEDRLVDYWIALESLFVPDTNQELRYRTALRIAAFLGSSGSERARIYDEVKQSYDLRSEIVHGSIGKRKRKVASADIIRLTRSCLSQSLLKILDSSVSYAPSELEVGLLQKE